MIETAKNAITLGAVEHTLGQAKESAAGTLGDLSERLKDADVVQQLRKLTRQELKHAKREWKHAAKQARKRAKKVARTHGRSKSRRSPVVGVIVVIGIAAVAAYVLQRRRAASTTDVAPDPFGAAVEQERAQGYLDRPVATPGA
jgi:hypothetical protein